MVRLDTFKVEENQAEMGIDWSIKAHYTAYPDETNYATCEATAEEKINFTGEQILNVAGKIQATNLAGAQTKLAAVVAAFLAQYGYGGKETPNANNQTPSQQLELNQTANLISANADGDTFTELTFNGSWRKWLVTNQGATFQATGAKTGPVTLGNVKQWDDGYHAEFFDAMRSERRHATGTVAASGTFAVSPSLALQDRRAALLAQQRRMKAECNNAEGTLTYGDFKQVVRVSDFLAHINQAETGIDWSFQAAWSMFPNEAGYATAEFSADVRAEVETGDQYLTFAGEILAPNGALARAKLAALRTATLGVYGFVIGQQTKAESTAHDISANGDRTSTVAEGMETAGDVAGVSFLKLSFTEEYRQRMAGSILNSHYTITTRDDTATGLLMTTYAGTVTATGPNADAAMAVALARAAVIGANQQGAIDPSAFLKSQTLTIEKRQTSDALAAEFIKVTFSYDYQSKLGAGRGYLEVNTAVNRDSFGTDATAVSGLVVAKDLVTAQAMYQQQVKGLYTGMLVRQESVTQAQVQAENPVANGAAPADTLAFTTQQLKLEFSFTVHLPKRPGRVTARYAISTQADFRSLKLTTRLHGSVYALDRATANLFIGVLGAVSTGQLMNSSRDEDHDYTPEVDVFMKLDFEDVYEGRLTGVAGLIEMEVSESVTYSATRWAVQDVPFVANGAGGVSIPQACGWTPGSRTVRGTVSSASKPTAQAWAKKYRMMLTGDALGNNYPQPEKWDTVNALAPRVAGIAVDGLGGVGSVANVQIYRVTFEFAEILPYYPAMA